MKRTLFSLSLLVSTFSFALPNPSYTYCIDQGGSYETRRDNAGNEDGVCMFNDEGIYSECGGWAYFRGTCAPGQCEHWSVETQSCETRAE